MTTDYGEYAMAEMLQARGHNKYCSYYGSCFVCAKYLKIKVTYYRKEKLRVEIRLITAKSFELLLKHYDHCGLLQGSRFIKVLILE